MVKFTVKNGGANASLDLCGVARAQRDLVLRTKLRAFHAASGQIYGRPRLWKDLHEDGEAVSEKRVKRLMRAATAPEPIRKAPEVHLVNLVEDGHHGLLNNLVLPRRDA